MAIQQEPPQPASESSRRSEGSVDPSQAVRGSVTHIQERGRGLASEARQQAEGAAEIGKKQTLQYVQSFTQAARQATESLNDQGHGDMAQAVERVVSQVEEVAARIANRRTADLIADAEQMAKDHPAWFAAGALLAGFGLARVLKASQAFGREAASETQLHETQIQEKPHEHPGLA